jgi:hypothetical protein
MELQQRASLQFGSPCLFVSLVKRLRPIEVRNQSKRRCPVRWWTRMTPTLISGAVHRGVATESRTPDRMAKRFHPSILDSRTFCRNHSGIYVL